MTTEIIIVVVIQLENSGDRELATAASDVESLRKLEFSRDISQYNTHHIDGKLIQKHSEASQFPRMNSYEAAKSPMILERPSTVCYLALLYYANTQITPLIPDGSKSNWADLTSGHLTNIASSEYVPLKLCLNDDKL